MKGRLKLRNNLQKLNDVPAHKACIRFSGGKKTLTSDNKPLIRVQRGREAAIKDGSAQTFQGLNMTRAFREHVS